MKFTTHASILPVTIILCSKLYCINVFELKPFFYKIRTRALYRGGGFVPGKGFMIDVQAVQVDVVAVFGIGARRRVPHQNANSLFTISNHNIKLTILWGS